MTLADISPVVSVSALLVSLFTAWFTIFRRGVVRSTHPSFISFSYDFIEGKTPWAKIFLRTLIFSTGKRGQVIESLFLRVHEGGRTAEFSFWGYGDEKLVRGSGYSFRVRYSHKSPLQSINSDSVFYSHQAYVGSCCKDRRPLFADLFITVNLEISSSLLSSGSHDVAVTSIGQRAELLRGISRRDWAKFIQTLRLQHGSRDLYHWLQPRASSSQCQLLVYEEA